MFFSQHPYGRWLLIRREYHLTDIEPERSVMKNGMLHNCMVVVAVTFGITFAGSAVGSSSWSGPLVLGTGRGTRMEFDARGNGIAIWAQATITGPLTTTLQVGRYDKVSNSWTVEQLPGTPSVGSAASRWELAGLSLSVAYGGDAIVAWSSSVGPSQYVTGYRVATNSWDTTPTLLASASSSTANFTATATAITATGLASLLGNHPTMATVAWQLCDAQCVLYAALWNGARWGLPTQLGTSFAGEDLTVGLENTSMANIIQGNIDQGNMVVVLSTPSNPPGAAPNVYINTYDANNSGTWSAASLFWTANAWGEVDPYVAFDNANNGLAVWTQDTILMARRYAASSGWSATPVTVGGGWSAASPSFAIDSNTGNAVLAFEAENPITRTFSAYVSLFSAATASWSTPTLLGNYQAVVPLQPGSVVAGIRGGNAVVGWLQYDSNNVATIFNVARWNGTAWGAAETLVPPANTSEIYGPAVGIDAQGDVSALWWQQDGNVYLNYYGPVAPFL
jgi:hypothetical protein